MFGLPALPRGSHEVIAPALVLVVALTAGSGAPRIVDEPCAAWHSESTPPPTIRVRLDLRHVVSVPFALYVARVVSSEWNKVAPQLRLAGAVAVKQYGWWKTLRPRRSTAGCFDVWADTRDQIYRVKSPPAYVWAAVRSTWPWRVLRAGRLVHTGYRTGQSRPCARDVDGYHLKARSAGRCAAAGWSAVRILERYYVGARVVR